MRAIAHLTVVQHAKYEVTRSAAAGRPTESIQLAGAFGRRIPTWKRTSAVTTDPKETSKPRRRLLPFLRPVPKDSGERADPNAASTDTKTAKPATSKNAATKTAAAPEANKTVSDKIAEMYARDGREMPDFDYQPVPVDTPSLKEARAKAGVKHPVLDATPEERVAMAAERKAQIRRAREARLAAARAEAAKGFELAEIPDADLSDFSAEDLFPENPLPDIMPLSPAVAEANASAATAAPSEATPVQETRAVAEAEPAEQPVRAKQPKSVWRKATTPTRWSSRVAATDPMEQIGQVPTEPLAAGDGDPLANVFIDGDVSDEEDLDILGRPKTPPRTGGPEPTLADGPDFAWAGGDGAADESSAGESIADGPSAGQRTPVNAAARDVVAGRPDSGLKGFCPVTLCDHRELADADARYATIYRDRTYTFSSSQALARFRENPSKYAPVVGGLDVVRLHATGHEVEGVLDHAAWYAGRLYLFSSADTLAIFTANPKAYPVSD